MKRFIEGPLGYEPHIVTSLGMVVKVDSTGKLKLRTCVDATASGFNDSLEKVYTKLDQVVNLIEKTTPNCYLSKIDLSDAFLQLPIEASHCDYMAFRNLHGEFWRYRFSPFGIAAAPWLCQRFAVELKEFINTTGLRHVPALKPDGSPNPAASYEGFEAAAAYIDDYGLVHPSWLTLEEGKQQLDSVVRSVQELGVLVKDEKVEGPMKVMEFLGVDIDSQECTVGVSDRKSDKLAKLIADFTEALPANLTVSRLDFSSIIGKLQFYAPYIKGAQGCLATCYKDRDSFVDQTVRARSMKGRWRSDVMVQITQGAISALKKKSSLLGTQKNKKYYHFEGKGMYWGDVFLNTDEALDRSSRTSCGAEVITTDAAGYGGGYWGNGFRVGFKIDPAHCAPHKSSNYRELYTIVRAVKEQAKRLQGHRVLIRTDNEVSSCIIKKQASNQPELNDLVNELNQICVAHDIDLQIRHIAGSRNHMADRLSRHLDHKYDKQDWQFLRSEFLSIQSEVYEGKEVYDWDACADPAGFNAQVAWFWSEKESCLKRSWQGKRVWCNPPYNNIKAILQHFLHEWACSPYDTSATFILPAWTWSSWWHLRSHFKTIRTYPKKFKLFTTPNWENTLDGLGKRPDRLCRGETSWPVIVLHKAAATQSVL